MNKRILVTQSSLPPIEEYINEIKPLWDTKQLTNMGIKHKQLESQLKDYLEVDNVSLFVNGHMALEMTIQAMNLNGEVITTPYTFASSTHAIVRNGLSPVFCDINDNDFTLDASKIEALVTDKTTAILPVHVYGNLCDIQEIGRIARKYGLKVIYDAAHAFGERYNGVGIGKYGDASIFSFHATKVFNSIEGGAVCFSEPEFYTDLYRLKNFGIRGPEKVDWIGSNAKMNEFQAAMGLCNLRYIGEEIKKRKKVDERYRNNLEGTKGIKLNIVQENLTSNYAYFPVIIDEKKFGASRNEIFAELELNGISARKYFYPLTNAFDCFHGKYDVNKTPVALYISKRVLTLPIYADLELENVDKVCDIILGLQADKKI